MKILKSISNILAKIESFLIILSVTVMVVISFSQVVLRNLAHFSFLWAEDLSRHLVLWIGFMGASLATREGKHISIDVISRGLPPIARSIVKAILNLVAFVGCIFLVIYALDFVGVEREFGEVSISLKVPIWTLQTIIPGAFIVIAYRFFVNFIDNVIEIIKAR